MPDAINLSRLSIPARARVLELRAAGHLFVYVRRNGNGWSIATQDAPGWALVLG